MKTIFSTLFFLIIVNTYSQSPFEKGYYLDNNGKRVEGFIKNIDWLNNPSSIFFKNTLEDNEVELSISDMLAFQVYNYSKYERHDVNIDLSYSNSVNNLDNSRNPSLKQEQLFLKLLVSGTAKLYSFTNTNFTHYFYSINNDKVEELVFKMYLVSNVQAKKNNRYQQQLYKSLSCSTIKESRFKKLDYKRSKLVPLFEDYNQCVDPNYNKGNLEKAKNINLRFKAGLSYYNSIAKESAIRFNDENEFSGFTYSVGFETEFVMNFFRKKFSVVLEPTYTSFKDEENFVSKIPSAAQPLNSYSVSVNYSKFDLPLGLRYKYFLPNNSSIYFTLSYSMFIAEKATANFSSSAVIREYDFSLNSRFSSLNLGYIFKDKYSLEFRYGVTESRNYDESNRGFKSNTLSLLVGYRLF